MFQKEPLTQVTTTGIKDQFEADGNDQSVNEKAHKGRKRTGNISRVMVTLAFRNSNGSKV